MMRKYMEVKQKIAQKAIFFVYFKNFYYLCAEFCVKTIINHKKQLYYV